MIGMPFVEPGFGTVEPCDDAGAIVHGVAHLISAKDFVRLHHSEGGGKHWYDERSRRFLSHCFDI